MRYIAVTPYKDFRKENLPRMLTFRPIPNPSTCYREIYNLVNDSGNVFGKISFSKDVINGKRNVEIMNYPGQMIRYFYLPEISEFVEKTLKRFTEEDKTPLDKLLEAVAAVIKANYDYGGTYNEISRLEVVLNNYKNAK